MGGWIALLLRARIAPARERPRRRVAGLVLIAPAVDFTEVLMWQRFPPEVKREIEENGVWHAAVRLSASPIRSRAA